MREVIPPHLDLMIREPSTATKWSRPRNVAIPGAAELGRVAAQRWPWSPGIAAGPRADAAGFLFDTAFPPTTSAKESRPRLLPAPAAPGQRPEQAVVFEDAPPGLSAGHAARCRTIALATNVPEHALADEEWLPDLSHLALAGIDADGRLRLSIR
jgi:sugar-phosphatase